MKVFKYSLLILLTSLFIGCASYKAQYQDKQTIELTKQQGTLAHSFYLVGDGGNSPIGTETATLKRLRAALKLAPKNSTLLFLGDNVYPAGMPKKGSKNRTFSEYQLNIQTSLAKEFKGKTVFIPGNHDWYSDGLKGLKRQEKYIENILGKNSFLPEKGCPIDKQKISKDIVLITIDTEWYLTNWDNHPTINDDCEIKTRAQFFEEYESLIKKARGKTTLVAMHHPMFSNGPHGGQFSWRQQLFPFGNNLPLPIIGSFLNLIRKMSGISNTDIQNKRYLELKKRMVTISQENDRVIFISGHEHTLQYLKEDNIPQIISGAGSKTSATRRVGNGLFSFGALGYAKLDIFTDGSASVDFISAKDNKSVFQTQVLPARQSYSTQRVKKNNDIYTTASIYSPEEVEKGSVYEYIWGKRYRKYYGTPIKAINVQLDTLFGGLTPVRKGGGHQSKSLRLQDKEGKEYVMRALRKNAVQYLQAVAFKNQYIEGQFNNTAPQKLLLDIFTGSHPYAPFVIGDLAKSIGVFHNTPLLYYLPKQPALKQFNREFGNELYMIERRATSGHGDNPNFGFSNTIISTSDMLKNLKKSTAYRVDEKAYIRARLFDMLIGDWDRHEDQWRWAEFKNGDSTLYKPIPRDRDQAFSIMADGILLKIATQTIAALRLMQSYGPTIKNVKWFNQEAYPLDMAIITNASRKDWEKEAQYIQEHLNDDVIHKAFLNIPTEINDSTIVQIKKNLKERRKKLVKIADQYANDLSDLAVIRGTDKDDWFNVKRLSNGNTKITGYRIIKGEKGPIFINKTYLKKNTHEIWIYGLDDSDTFHVFGTGKTAIKTKIIGGQNNDTYIIRNSKNLKIYDFKSKKNTFKNSLGRRKLTDNYDINSYNYKKLKDRLYNAYPLVGYNPDDGLKVGLNNIYTVSGFERNPFTEQYRFSAAYYLETNGFEMHFSSEFASIFKQWNVGIEATFTSPNYSINFFGYGNETSNPNYIDEDNYEEDYNRVKIRIIKAQPFIKWQGELGGSFKVGISYEDRQVQKTPNRFISNYLSGSNSNSTNQFLGVETSYHFENQDNRAYPTLGMQVTLDAGYKSNINNGNAIAYLIPSLSFNYKLTANGQLVLATKLKAHITIGDKFEFYQVASIGGYDGLRGYRNQRFTGKNSFYQNTDIRFNILKAKTSLVPLNMGVFTGIDYGKVWIKNQSSSSWKSSFGGGFFLNAADLISANIGLFKGAEFARIIFSLGFTF